ncbi:MAG TPA: methyltransferase domain-containing protein [Pirellulales bacterium]|nr:methyltransferase domain-containing protein [Pirellulales bacterium]
MNTCLCPVCACQGVEAFDDLRHCPRCRHVFQWPPEATVSYDESYVRHYEAYPCREMSCLRVGFLKGFASRGRLLDVGYGNGAFVRAASAAGFDAFGCDVHGVDCGVREIDLARDQSLWDVVSCFDSLEHFGDFSSVRSLWRRAQLVLVSLPLAPPAFPACRAWSHYKPGEHLHYFSPASLARLVAKPLIAASNVEDAIRRPKDTRQNIYTAVYGECVGT